MPDPTQNVAVSVVIPAFNEIERLPPTLDKVRAYLKNHYETSEILVADDGSTDGTADILPQRFPDVKFLRAPRNQGKGAAVRRGMLEARGELRLFTDADLSTPIEEMAKLQTAMEENDYQVVVASRGLPGSVLEVRQPWLRELAGRAFNVWVRPLSGLRIRDTQCGFKLFRGGAARAIFALARDNGWAFDVEVLMIAAMLGYSIGEVPVRWINDEGSKVNFLRDGPRMAFDILRFRWWRFTGAYAESGGGGEAHR